jgi:hypothetical protein
VISGQPLTVQLASNNQQLTTSFAFCLLPLLFTFCLLLFTTTIRSSELSACKQKFKGLDFGALLVLLEDYAS